MTLIQRGSREVEEVIKHLPTRPIEKYNIRTKKEMEHEEYIHQEALKLGINLDMTDDVNNETEDLDKLEALIYLVKGKKVPEDLEKRILDKNKKEEYKNKK